MFDKFKQLLVCFPFQQKLEWWVKFRNPKDILEKHPTFLVGEVYMIINSLLCLYHGKFYYAVCCSNYVDVWICSSMLSVSLRIEMSDEVYQKGARNNMKKNNFEIYW